MNPLAHPRGPSTAIGTSMLRLTALLFCWQLSGAEQSPKPTEYQVKAAYLANFGKFIQWPGSATGNTFPICVLGQDPFGNTLDKAVEGETVNHAPMEAKRLTTPLQAAGCRILFISSSENDQLAAIVGALEKTAVLTVSDAPKFVKQGGIIEFVPAGSRIRFEINLPAAQQAGLTLSSELLKLAVSVQRTRQDEEK